VSLARVDGSCAACYEPITEDQPVVCQPCVDRQVRETVAVGDEEHGHWRAQAEAFAARLRTLKDDLQQAGVDPRHRLDLEDVCRDLEAVA
jgi:hypothetical protein